MIARTERQRPLVLVGLALAIAVPLSGLSGRIAPPPGFTSVETANDFAAIVGLVWAAAIAWRNRRSDDLRRAWIAAAFGALLIAVDDRLDTILPVISPPVLTAAISAALWIGVAYFMFACGRRYAMRRWVMAIMQAALAAEAAALVLAFISATSNGAGAHPAVRTLQELCEFSTTLLFVSALLVTQVGPMKSYLFPPNEVGRRARRLFYDFGLETRRRYPTPYPALAIPGLSHLLTVAIVLWYAPRAAPAASQAGGRSILRQILDLLRLGFMQGIDAKSYYVHDLYLPTACAVDETMTRVETKNGLNKALQGLRADHGGPRDMNDKLAFWRACEAYGVPSAPILAGVEDGTSTWLAERARFDCDLFVKERRGRGGRDTLTFERVAPLVYRDDDGSLGDLDCVFLKLSALSMDRRLIVQPKLHNHAEIRSLADRALVVFRVMTCLDQRGEPHVTHGVLRLLRRFEPAWPRTPDADWGCAIDVETGEFGLMTGDAPETCTRWFADHPATGERVTGRRLEGWSEIADLARAAHRVFASRVLVGWDIAWTPKGARILEGNSNPDFSYFQRVSRTPVGRSPLAPLLNAHFDELTARLIREARSR